MIEHFSLQEHLSFKACSLEFEPGLIVFTGPSGAGKSVLMQALLGLFGYAEVVAQSLTCSLNAPLDLENFGFEASDVTLLKALRGKSVRYFVNDQPCSKKGMQELCKPFVHYLSLKDAGEFESERLLAVLDGVCGLEEAEHLTKLEVFQERFLTMQALRTTLETLEAEELSVEERKEFARFEIAKIDAIAPKIGEDETLLALKKSLSKKEKIAQALHKASLLFELEPRVHEALQLIEKPAPLFDEAMAELRHLFESEQQTLDELEELDVEHLLDRIEKIAALKKRYGSIEAALEARQKKHEELQRYENLSFEKSALVKELAEYEHALGQMSEALHVSRKRHLPRLIKRLNHYLKALYMPDATLSLESEAMHVQGCDTLMLRIAGVEVKKISSGEYNRLRLAFLATHNHFLRLGGGILFLDEIDANLSGKESMSVALVLKELASRYQIFAISHQPQLSSYAHQHFKITKDASQQSFVRALSVDERIEELARMVSGACVSEEALHFAKSLLQGHQS